MAVDQTAVESWCSVAEAATRLGLPERAIYRQVATQVLRARRDESGALLVCLDDEFEQPEAPATDRLAVKRQAETALTPERARALTEFASGLLNPLVSRLAQQEEVIREQAEEIGRLRSQIEIASESDDHLAPAFARQMAELALIREEIERLSVRPRWWPFG